MDDKTTELLKAATHTRKFITELSKMNLYELNQHIECISSITKDLTTSRAVLEGQQIPSNKPKGMKKLLKDKPDNDNAVEDKPLAPVIHIGVDVFKPAREIRERLVAHDIELDEYLLLTSSIVSMINDTTQKNKPVIHMKKVKEHMGAIFNAVMFGLELGFVVQAWMNRAAHLQSQEL
jgi:hypothetical protein